MARRDAFERGGETTGRANTKGCLVLLAVLALTIFLAVPTAAPPPIPMRTDGHALDRTGAPLPLGTPIRTFVDGVDYSNGPSVSDAQGSFAILTTGNSVTSGGASELAGTIPPQSPLRVNLSLPLSLIPTGDALKLVYRNPGGAGATAGGGDIVVDRVEYNATKGGTLTWEPGNTILGDAPAPTVGRILERDAACTDSNSPQDFSLGIEPGLPANQPPTLTIQSPTDGQTFQASSAVTFAWTISDDIFANADLLVWANVTIGNVTTPLLAAAGATSVVWTAPDIAADGVVVHVDVVDPFGAKASAGRTFNLTRQTPFAILIAVLIAAVLLAFLVYGLLRARKKEGEATARPPPAGPPQPPPQGPATVPPAAPAATASTKACPRCHTIVKAEDVACFFCGYSFTEGKPSP